MKLLTWLDRHSPSVALLIVLGTFAAAALIAGVGRLPQPALAKPTPALIYILSTPVPTMQPTPDTTMQREIAALKARVTELEAGRSARVTEAPAVYQEMSVQE